MALKLPPPEAPSLNLTPMIDIVFLLIIFFMVGTKFTELERRLTLEVPQVQEAGPMAPAPKARTVSVYRDGRIELDGEATTLDELTRQLELATEQYAGTSVIVRGDGDSSFQTVAEVLAACRKAGISDLGITVRIARTGAGVRR